MICEKLVYDRWCPEPVLIVCVTFPFVIWKMDMQWNALKPCALFVTVRRLTPVADSQEFETYPHNLVRELGVIPQHL